MPVWQGGLNGAQTASHPPHALRLVAGLRIFMVFLGRGIAKTSAPASPPAGLTAVARRRLPPSARHIAAESTRPIAVVVPDGPVFSDVTRPSVA